jgi:hypothetical protein
MKCDSVEPVDTQLILQQLNVIKASNEEVTKKVRERDRASHDLDESERAKVKLDEQRDELLMKLQTIEANVKKAEEDIERKRAILAEMPGEFKITDTSVVEEKLRTASDINIQAEQFKAYQKAVKELSEAKKASEILTTKLDGIKAEKVAAVAKSPLPFKNLEFDPEVGLLIDGIPFSQRSSSEKLRISARIGMQLKPGLRVLYIPEGSLLDDDSYAAIKEMAEKLDYQVLVEVVGEAEGENVICLREGRLISEFTEGGKKGDLL